MKKNGFTLAEVLITLSIIGVIAALTMPTLVVKYQKLQTVTQLKKVYSVLNQAMRLSEVDNGDYAGWDTTLSAKDYNEKYWLPYFRVMKICDTYQDCGYTSGYPWFGSNGVVNSTAAVSPSLRTTFITAEGILYSIWMYTSSVGNVSHYIVIDLNNSKPPNQYGKDVFWFERAAEKGVLPGGWGSGTADCSTTGIGFRCAAKIANDGWEIKDDYPWL
jgi:prepilin-type N-terminal cleavage/methylation domain-containing protein